MSRQRAHIAMVGIPAISHVLPSLEIIRELVARGHRVTYANDPAVADVIAPTGAELVAYRSTLPVAENDWPADPIAAMCLFLDDAMHVLPRLRAVYDADPADLYLYDIGGYAARALAERQGRPTVQLSPSHVAWGTFEEEVGAQLRALPGVDAYFARFAAWLAEYGATTTDAEEFGGRPSRAVAMVPRAMQPHADTVDPRIVSFVGPCLGGPGPPGLLDPPGRRRAGAAGLARLGLHPADRLLPPLPGGLRRPARLACRAAGREVHGPRRAGAGPGQCGGARVSPAGGRVAAGRPVRDARRDGRLRRGARQRRSDDRSPAGADQFANADRLVELGVARRVDTEDATPQALRAALLQLTGDAEVARRLAELRAHAKAEGGTARAADLIEAELPPR